MVRPMLYNEKEAIESRCIMGRVELEAPARVLQEQLSGDNLALGSWAVQYDKERGAFVFDKCEHGGYCEERPSVIALDGSVLDHGGPIFSS